jgi:hypothetical protein
MRIPFQNVMVNCVLAGFLSIHLSGCSENVKPSPNQRPPTVESIQALLALVKFDAIVDGLRDRANDLLRARFGKVAPGKELNPVQIKVLEEFNAKALAVVDDEISWARIEPVLVRIFRECYSQQDVDALIAFYHSSAGQAVVAKVPQAIQAFTQERLDAWAEIRRTKGEQAVRDRVAEDFGASFRPQEVDGFVAFFESNIGRDIVARLPNAKTKYDEETQKLKDEVQMRLQQLLADCQVQLKAAAKQ